MMPILYVIAATLLSISLLIGLPRGVNLVQSKVEARNIPNNKIIPQGEFQPPMEIQRTQKLLLAQLMRSFVLFLNIWKMGI